MVWGGNPVSTQVNAMVHIARARKRGAKLVVIDVYQHADRETADVALIIRPGTDAALACAVMHVLLAEGMADRDYLARYTDFGPDVEAHLAGWTPEWAAPITGLDGRANRQLCSALWLHAAQFPAAGIWLYPHRATAVRRCTP